MSQRERVQALLAAAAEDHRRLLAGAPAMLAASLPVDAQGLTRAIDLLAQAAGFSESERRELVRAHAVNPAVLHARVFGGEALAPATVLASFVDGARVRAEALAAIADRAGGSVLGARVRQLLIAHPPPADGDAPDAMASLRATYSAQEQAALLVASGIDAFAV